jgi:hypothetical protein
MTALVLGLLVAGQVHLDTVLRFEFCPTEMVYVESSDRLLVFHGDHESLYVLNCDDYSVEKAIPLNARAGVPAYWTWNWQRDKYYFVLVRPDSLAVFDPVCDSITRWLPIYGTRSPCYVSAHDWVYVVDGTQMRVVDCATDSFIRDVPPGAYSPWGAVSWDSIGDKVYATAYDAPSEDVLLAHSCVNDSPVAAVSTGILYPTVLAFYPPLHRAYLGSDWRTDNVASYDCQSDSVIRLFPITYRGRGFVRDSYNAARGKLYVPSRGSTDTLCAIDCATDSIVSRTTLPAGVSDIEMAHRTDRLFLTVGMTRVMVLDCGADTLLGPGIETGWGPGYIAYDSGHSRVFVSCEDSSIYVLSDDTAGVAERQTSLRAKWSVTVSPNPVTDNAIIRWQVPTDAEVSLRVYNTAGLLVTVLADGRFKPGSYTSIWNGTDSRGRQVPRGVYFYRLDTPGYRAVKKAVVTR